MCQGGLLTERTRRGAEGAVPVEVRTDVARDPGLPLVQLGIDVALVGCEPRLKHGGVEVEGPLSLWVPEEQHGHHLGLIVQRDPARRAALPCHLAPPEGKGAGEPRGGDPMDALPLLAPIPDDLPPPAPPALPPVIRPSSHAFSFPAARVSPILLLPSCLLLLLSLFFLGQIKHNAHLPPPLPSSLPPPCLPFLSAPAFRPALCRTPLPKYQVVGQSLASRPQSKNKPEQKAFMPTSSLKQFLCASRRSREGTITSKCTNRGSGHFYVVRWPCSRGTQGTHSQKRSWERTVRYSKAVFSDTTRN